MSTPPPTPESEGAAPPPYTPPATAPAAAPAAPAYAAPAAPPAPAAGPKPKGPKGLGLIAFVAALAAVVIGSILAYVAGSLLGGIAQYAGAIDPETGEIIGTVPEGFEADAVAGGFLALGAFAVYGILALWGLIQGIIAAVKNRGRGWAIAAIIVAVLGVGVVVTFLSIGTAVAAAPYAGTLG